MKILQIAEIVCDGGSKSWEDGRCAYARYLVRTEHLSKQMHIDFAGKFGTESSGYAEWNSIVHGARCLNAMIRNNRQSPGDFHLCVYMDCLPIITALMTGWESKKQHVLNQQNRARKALKGFGFISYQWMPRGYINRVLGC